MHTGQIWHSKQLVSGESSYG